MRSTLAALLAALFALTAAAQPPAPNFKPIPVPAPNVPGGQVVLVPRAQLRAGPGVKTARLHPAVRAAAESKAIPVPAEWDWTKGDSIKLPILGNDSKGDCYYVAPAHVFQLYGGMAGKPIAFDVNALIRRYEQLSGGDNGLSDSDVFPEVKAGIVGPNGPHKLLDVLVVSATDKTAVDLTGWAFGPQMFTFTVYSNFMNVGPGTVLDGNTGGVQGGHAVVISGKKADGKRKLETWAIQPSVLVTDKWVAGVEPEYVACFSLEWFDSKGFAPNGLHYNDLAPLWNSMGGSVPAVGPFPPPNPQPPTPPIPPVPPTPPGPPVPPQPPLPGPTPGGFTGTLVYQGGQLVGVYPGVVTPPGPTPNPAAGLEADLTAAGVCPAAIAAALQLYADIKAKAGYPVILTDVLMLYAAYQSCKNPPPAGMSAAPGGYPSPVMAAAGDCGRLQFGAAACSSAGAGACGQAGAGFSLRHPFGGFFANRLGGAAAGSCGNAATVQACGPESAYIAAGACGQAAVSYGACGQPAAAVGACGQAAAYYSAGACGAPAAVGACGQQQYESQRRTGPIRRWLGR